MDHGEGVGSRDCEKLVPEWLKEAGVRSKARKAATLKAVWAKQYSRQ